MTLHCVMNPNFREFLEILTKQHSTEHAITTIEGGTVREEGIEKDPEFDLHVEQVASMADVAAAREFLAEHFRPRTSA